MSKIVELRNVTKTYKTGERELRALDNVTLLLDAGELVVVLGPSGSGKSTMLNLIGGMDSVTEGTVIIDGKDITNYNEAQLSDFRTENIGFIFQFYNILPTLTAIENIELVKEVIGKPVDARQALSDVGLAEHANKFPAQLSGGEQQRISIARAVAKNPRLLLCDEPTGALDSVTGVEVLKLLHSHSRKDAGNTVLIVTHNSLFAEIADTVIHVKNGKIESVNKNKQPKNIDEVKW